MTPKEKARELVNKYYIHSLKGKECALIAVDTTIQTLNEDIRDLDVRGNVLLDLIDYWREVKQEINKR